MTNQAAVLARAETRLTRLAAENERLKAEALRLRRKLRPGRAALIIDRARDDAALILHYRHAGIPAGRRQLAAMGVMSQDQFGWAYALLKRARIENATPDDIHHLDHCLRRLDSTVMKLHATPDAMDELRSWAGRSKLRNIYRRFF